MSEKKGWIKLHRQLQDCWIWSEKEPFDRRSAWIDLLLLANHADKKILFDGKLITVTKGQYLTSVRKLSERWMWSRPRVNRFLDVLVGDNMIVKESNNHRTLINIVNYRVFQDTEATNVTTPITTPVTTEVATPDTTTVATPITQTRMIKNDKNEKNEEEIVSSPPADFEKAWNNTFKIYPRKGAAATAKAEWFHKVGHVIKENQEEVATLIYKGVKMYLREYKTQNPDDSSYKYIPNFDKWLKEDCDYWITQAEKASRGDET